MSIGYSTIHDTTQNVIIQVICLCFALSRRGTLSNIGGGGWRGRGVEGGEEGGTGKPRHVAEDFAGSHTHIHTHTHTHSPYNLSLSSLSHQLFCVSWYQIIEGVGHHPPPLYCPPSGAISLCKLSQLSQCISKRPNIRKKDNWFKKDKNKEKKGKKEGKRKMPFDFTSIQSRTFLIHI